jgi:RNA polymerase sigma-70 factor (family 1)
MRELPYDESDVLKKLTQGDGLAFKLLYDRYWFGIYKTVKRYTKSSELAEDIVQEIFTTLWNSRGHFLQVINLEFYLVTMAKNLTYKTLRKIAFEQTLQNNLVRDLQSEEITENTLLDQQYTQLIEQAVGLLPSQQKQIFQLAKVDGLSHKDIAGQLKISHLTVKTHMAKALRFIRHYLQPHLGHYAICIAFFENLF